MSPDSQPVLSIGDRRFFRLTPERWADLELLFGARGAVGGCWCMDRRLPRGQFEAGRGEENRDRLRAMASRAIAPGLLSYAAGDPIGWVAVGPRSDFPVFDRSVVTRGVRDLAEWIIACIFVAPGHRRSGVGTDLIRAAAAYARQNGARRIDGYPVDGGGERVVDVFAFTGTSRQFADAGFVEVARRRPTRPIMRWEA